MICRSLVYFSVVQIPFITHSSLHDMWQLHCCNTTLRCLNYVSCSCEATFWISKKFKAFWPFYLPFLKKRAIWVCVVESICLLKCIFDLTVICLVLLSQLKVRGELKRKYTRWDTFFFIMCRVHYSDGKSCSKYFVHVYAPSARGRSDNVSVRSQFMCKWCKGEFFFFLSCHVSDLL